MNWPKILDLALHNGKDPQSGQQLGPETGQAASFQTFEQLLEAYERQLGYFIDLKIDMNNKIERLFAEEMRAPFLSVLVDDCIDKGADYNDSGPRYPTTYIQGVGLGTTTDALAAIQTCVYDAKSCSMEQLLEALDSNYSGHDSLRQQLVAAPKYGNDDARADSLARRVFDICFGLEIVIISAHMLSMAMRLLVTRMFAFCGCKR